MSQESRISQYYKASAIILLNTLVVFLLINLIIFVFFKIKDNSSKQSTDTNPVSLKYRDQAFEDVYPDLNKEERKLLLKETWSRPYIYEPFTQFKERPYTGTYVNVDENGFRLTSNQGPWPPDPNDFNIFMFGGSTTFGYGVPDHQTIASYFQENIHKKNGFKQNFHVYNFGRGAYYSTQERILFETLLTAGFIPDMAIFVDGWNDFFHYDDKPHFTGKLDNFFQERDPRRGKGKKSDYSAWAYLLKFLGKLPISVAVNNLMPQSVKARKGDSDSGEPEEKGELIVEGVINTYIENKKMIETLAAAYGVQPIFVWQPVPTYQYDLKYHLFAKDDFGKGGYSTFGYPRMAELVKENALGDNFLWCADIQGQLKEPLYVDKFHYSAKMSKNLADNIHELLLRRDLLGAGEH